MSQPDTGAQQLRRLGELHHRTDLLPRLRDVDHFDDALAVATELPRSRTAHAVATVALGERFGLRAG